ncbi:hypothetical protein GGR53DRAFT_462795 [Hypoxylon sp. FL1150]|nr:hypothetical protein GGR53DRAFT_462795 [Hypoxylon sp. FL1150]
MGSAVSIPDASRLVLFNTTLDVNMVLSAGLVVVRLAETQVIKISGGPSRTGP